MEAVCDTIIQMKNIFLKPLTTQIIRKKHAGKHIRNVI